MHVKYLGDKAAGLAERAARPLRVRYPEISEQGRATQVRQCVLRPDITSAPLRVITGRCENEASAEKSAKKRALKVSDDSVRRAVRLVSFTKGRSRQLAFSVLRRKVKRITAESWIPSLITRVYLLENTCLLADKDIPYLEGLSYSTLANNW